jgi:hypothetical protein
MNEQIISGENYWVAYNNSPYFIDPNDIFFFNNKDAANEFADNNTSDRDHYVVISIKKQGNDPDANGLYNSDGNFFTDALIDHIEQQQLLINKNKVMNEKNLEYLKDNLRYQGFGESLQRPLEQNITEGKTEFTLQHKATYNNQAMENTLHFRKGDQNEMYFFNKYDAKLLQPEELSQTFYLDKGNGVTTKEAFNLLNGRPVHKELASKEGEKYTAWVQLDLSKKEENGNYKLNRYHENYGYNLEKALGQYPIKELGDPKLKEDLMKSMEKGNLQAVKMEVKGKEETYFIQADPQYKDIQVFNKNQVKLGREQVAGLKAELSLPGQSAKQEQKQMNHQKQAAGGGEDDGPELKKKRTRKKGIAI